MTRTPRSPRHVLAAALLLATAAVTTAACRGAGKSGEAKGAATADAKTTAAAGSPVRGAGNWGGDSIMERADASRIQGSPAAKLWMIEISDFQCPFCRQWHEETYAAIKRDYVDTGKIRFAYVNLPLPMHRHAKQAASVAMCAGLQGKFWAMHDALFDSQERWEKLDSAGAAGVFDSLTAAAGADAKAVRRCVNAGTLAPIVQADYDRSVGAGVSSTPTFFVGSATISGAMPLERFRATLDSALAAGAGR